MCVCVCICIYIYIYIYTYVYIYIYILMTLTDIKQAVTKGSDIRPIFVLTLWVSEGFTQT